MSGPHETVLLRLDGQVHYAVLGLEAGLVMTCLRCGSERTRRDGQTGRGGQLWRCHACGRRFTARSTSACTNHGFPDEVIALAVRWYVRGRPPRPRAWLHPESAEWLLHAHHDGATSAAPHDRVGAVNRDALAHPAVASSSKRNAVFIVGQPSFERLQLPVQCPGAVNVTHPAKGVVEVALELEHVA